MQHNSTRPIKLFGASGHAKVIKDIIEAQGDSVECLYDDSPKCENLYGSPVKKASESNVNGPLIISVGLNKFRKAIAERYDVKYATAIHPTAIISPHANIGEGSVVMQGAIIQADARVGKHCIINTGASVDHECVVGDYAHISPHCTLCGNVHVDEGTWIGAGTTIIPGVKIGRWCVIGAGTVVTEDVADGVLVVGNRCKTIKILEQGMLTSVKTGGGKLSSSSSIASEI